MSLWEKWERENLERQGIKVEYKSDVDIRDTHPKGDIRKQVLIAGGALLACLLAVYFALVLNAMAGGNWSNLYIVRFLVEKEEQRMSISSSPQ